MIPRTDYLMYDKRCQRKGGIYLKNEGIREEAKSKGVLLWQIADKLGISDNSFSRRLRHELTQEEQQRIMRLIDELANDTVASSSGLNTVQR